MIQLPILLLRSDGDTVQTQDNGAYIKILDISLHHVAVYSVIQCPILLLRSVGGTVQTVIEMAGQWCLHHQGIGHQSTSCGCIFNDTAPHITTEIWRWDSTDTGQWCLHQDTGHQSTSCGCIFSDTVTQITTAICWWHSTDSNSNGQDNGAYIIKVLDISLYRVAVYSVIQCPILLLRSVGDTVQTQDNGAYIIKILDISLHHVSEYSVIQRPILLLWSDGVTSQLVNGSSAFICKLHCHWLRSLWQHHIIVVIQTPAISWSLLSIIRVLYFGDKQACLLSIPSLPCCTWTYDQKMTKLAVNRDLVGKVVCCSYVTHQKVISYSWILATTLDYSPLKSTSSMTIFNHQKRSWNLSISLASDPTRRSILLWSQVFAGWL